MEVNTLGSILGSVSSDALDAIGCMLHYDSLKRFTAA